MDEGAEWRERRGEERRGEERRSVCDDASGRRRRGNEDPRKGST